MAVMVKVLAPSFHDVLAMPPLVKLKKELLLIVLVRLLPKTSVLPGLRGLFSGGKSEVQRGHGRREALLSRRHKGTEEELG